MDLPAGYREWAPPAALAPAVACLWAQVTHGSARRSVVLPDGCTDLVWQAGGPAFVAGPDTGPVPTVLPPGTVLIGARFRPGAGGDVLGLPLSELRDLRAELADVRSDLARRLPAALDPEDAEDRVTDIAGRLAVAGPPGRAVMRACLLLADPAARTGEVAAEVGLSERQLRRRCEAAVGYGPKMLQRVLRFRRFVSLADRAGLADLGAAAAACGYADQPHLTRETGRLAGLPPAALVRERQGD